MSVGVSRSPARHDRARQGNRSIDMCTPHPRTSSSSPELARCRSSADPPFSTMLLLPPLSPPPLAAASPAAASPYRQPNGAAIAEECRGDRSPCLLLPQMPLRGGRSGWMRGPIPPVPPPSPSPCASVCLWGVGWGVRAVNRPQAKGPPPRRPALARPVRPWKRRRDAPGVSKRESASSAIQEASDQERRRTLPAKRVLDKVRRGMDGKGGWVAVLWGAPGCGACCRRRAALRRKARGGRRRSIRSEPLVVMGSGATHTPSMGGGSEYDSIRRGRGLGDRTIGLIGAWLGAGWAPANVLGLVCTGLVCCGATTGWKWWPMCRSGRRAERAATAMDRRWTSPGSPINQQGSSTGVVFENKPPNPNQQQAHGTRP